MALLEMEHLSFVSDGKVILDDITYSLEEGEFLSITGPSGSGKSTLMKIIATILSRTEGEIRYQGKSLDAYEPTEYRKEVSYTFQTPVLFGKTVRDNLAFPYEIRKKEFDEKKAVAYLESLGLQKEYLDKAINTLSGGEKQRVALIRNVLFQPKILLLDEVTSALDEANRQIIWKWLQEMREHADMTIIMVSHNEEESSLADKNIHIVAGKIVKGEGTKMDLQVSPITLMLSFSLVMVGVYISYKEKLGTAKDILYSIARAVVQLIAVGYVLTYLFNVNNTIVTLVMVAVIVFNASWNAHKRSSSIPNSLKISLIAISASAILTLSILVLSGSVKFIPSQIVPITGMIAGNAMTTIGLCYRNLNSLFRDQRQQILEKLSLGATPNQASRTILRETIKSGMQPSLDSAKTVGIVSLPGMMSGLMFAGTVPMTAIMYQIMVTFMLVAATSISSYIASFLAYREFYNDRQQLRV